MLNKALTIVRTANACARWTAVKLAKIEVRLERIRQPDVCPCETDVEEPGPHIASCPWRDPNYAPEFFT